MNIQKASAEGSEIVTIGLAPGEMLLESIRAAIKSENIESGVVISGIGTLKSFRMHYIIHTKFPPADRFVTIQKPLELVSVSGIIVQGEPHLHAVVSVMEEAVYAGHLEDGSEVLYLAEVAILKCNSLKMSRKLHAEYNVKLLGA